MDKDFILNLSKKANVALMDTEVDYMLKELTLFNEGMLELYSVDTSNFANSEEVAKTLDIIKLRLDN